MQGGNECGKLSKLKTNVDEQVGDRNGKARVGSRCGGVSVKTMVIR